MKSHKLRIILYILIIFCLVSSHTNYALSRTIRTIQYPIWLSIHPAQTRKEIEEFEDLAYSMEFPQFLPKMESLEQGMVIATDKRTNRVIGGFNYHFRPRDDITTIHISFDLLVHPDYQYQDIGTFLFREFVNIMKGYDYEAFTFQCSGDDSVEFFQKMGAEIDKTLPREEGSRYGDVLYIMKYTIPKG